jgi:hypothetical protein
MKGSTSSKPDGRSWNNNVVRELVWDLRVWIFFWILMSSWSAQSQENELGSGNVGVNPNPPTVEEIFERYEQSLGGKSRLEAISTRVVSGALEITDFGIRAKALIEEKAPYFRKFSLQAPGLGETLEVYSENQGWIKSPSQGVVQKSTEELRLNKRINGFHRDLNLENIYQSFSVKELTKSQNEEVYVVECTSEIGEVDRLYFSVNSGLLVREEPFRVAQDGDSVFTIYYEEYGSLNGIRYPSKIRVQPPFGGIIRFDVEEISFDKPIEDSYFSKPQE